MSGQRVGIVGDKRAVEVIEAAGAEPIEDMSTFDNVAFVVAYAEPAIRDLADVGVDVPILAVDVESGVPSIELDRLEASIKRIQRDEPPTVGHPVVAVTGSFPSVRTVFDVALMAAEPARISEFSVCCDGERVSRFRADGVVASTPAGSTGYNRNAGGPVIEPGLGVVSVVPIAPFATAAGHWVLRIDSVEFRIERDETPVELLADGRRELLVEAGDPITLSTTGTIETYVLADSAGAFGNRSGPTVDE
ncbi:MAG: NAD(+)/NADH kinase [Halobacteriota archaeon]|uniref:NAD(+)/NADH kinase n=1 Tax=Natronomonas sp. TaxID=2184060 RepID=UPI003975C427